MQLVIPQHPTTPNIVKKFHAGQNFFKNLKSGRQKYFQDGSNTHIHTHGVAETLCTTTHQYTHTHQGLDGIMQSFSKLILVY